MTPASMQQAASSIPPTSEIHPAPRARFSASKRKNPTTNVDIVMLGLTYLASLPFQQQQRSRKHIPHPHHQHQGSNTVRPEVQKPNQLLVGRDDDVMVEETASFNEARNTAIIAPTPTNDNPPSSNHNLTTNKDGGQEEEVFTGWLARSPTSAMAHGSFTPKRWAETDVDIRVTHCGVCASDLHTLRSGWVCSVFYSFPTVLYVHVSPQGGGKKQKQRSEFVGWGEHQKGKFQKREKKKKKKKKMINGVDDDDDDENEYSEKGALSHDSSPSLTTPRAKRSTPASWATKSSATPSASAPSPAPESKSVTASASDLKVSPAVVHPARPVPKAQRTTAPTASARTATATPTAVSPMADSRIAVGMIVGVCSVFRRGWPVRMRV
ncbi:MAG: hypothetical protein L6R40_003130 [Gallowayella cf. fulva]|nr:MAG: hypothetical protein L6R40_003130 [Xanthomendoza cf. fulva]